jgi:hypothetical protein
MMRYRGVSNSEAWTGNCIWDNGRDVLLGSRSTRMDWMEKDESYFNLSSKSTQKIFSFDEMNGLD